MRRDFDRRFNTEPKRSQTAPRLENTPERAAGAPPSQVSLQSGSEAAVLAVVARPSHDKTSPAVGTPPLNCVGFRHVAEWIRTEDHLNIKHM